jgi:hypothetical protein
MRVVANVVWMVVGTWLFFYSFHLWPMTNAWPGIPQAVTAIAIFALGFYAIERWTPEPT